MKIKMKILPAALLAALLALPVQANELAPAMTSYVIENVVPWASDPMVIAAILAGNAAHAGLSQAGIDTLDKAWRAEVGTALTPTITPVVSNPVSDFLRQRLGSTAGKVTEVFVMDDRGLLVGASGITSDYWQGDEEKWSMTYPRGPGAVHIGEVGFDDSSQTYQAQVSFAVVDPATGLAIGAVTVGLDADAMR